MAHPPAKWNGSLDGVHGWDMRVPPSLAEVAEEDRLCPHSPGSGPQVRESAGCRPQSRQAWQLALGQAKGLGLSRDSPMPSCQHRVLGPLFSCGTASPLPPPAFPWPLSLPVRLYFFTLLYSVLFLSSCASLCLILCLFLCSSSSFLASLSVYE